MENMESVSLSDEEGGEEDIAPTDVAAVEVSENHQSADSAEPAEKVQPNNGPGEEPPPVVEQADEVPAEESSERHLEQEVVRLETQRGQLASEVLAKENTISDLELNNSRLKSQVEQLEAQLKANEDSFASKMASLNEEVKVKNHGKSLCL